MRVAIGSDHAGFELKQSLVAWLQSQGYAPIDLGTDSASPVDYPDFAEKVGDAVASGRADRGVLICGSGVGASVAANKLAGVRAGLCHDIYSAHQGVEHDDMNVLVLGSRVIGAAVAPELVHAFLNARYTAEERHARRLQKVLALERRGRAAAETALPAVRRVEIHVLDDLDRLSRAAAVAFGEHAREAVAARGRFCVALSGGSTPRALYALLAQSGGDAPAGIIPWSATHLFWGDERHVPPDHADSNYRMVHEVLLSRVAIPPDNVHRVPAENSEAAQAAGLYEETLRNLFGLSAGDLPRFDLILLGMGPDGHTASLFPETQVLHEQQRLVAACWVEKFAAFRITLTPPVLNAAARVMFLVSGHDKSETVRAVLAGPDDPDRLPAQLIHPVAGSTIWLLDRLAAESL